MTQFPYVAIEGVIGVGKTTLARYLQAALESELLLEVFEENPFLKDFYADRARYAFQNQTFFLLSRYRQQNQITDTVSHRPLVTDYLFHKNWIFAQLNLFDDELAVFENLYKALAKRIPIPRLVIYLRANVDTLMERIAIRDRPYERDMQRDYIVNLYQAYDVFFDGYTQSQVITIDTDGLNIVHELHDRQALLGQITETLQSGIQQPALLEMEREIPPLTPEFLQNGSRRLTEFQQFHTALDKAKGFDPDLYINYILLTEEVGELGSEITKVWGIQRKAQEENIGASDAQALALQERQASLKSELADCLAYLLKLANYSGIDLEEAYIEKMIGNIDRAWAHKPGLAHINHQQ